MTTAARNLAIDFETGGTAHGVDNSLARRIEPGPRDNPLFEGSAHPAIRLYQADLSGNERKYVLECLESSWISGNGDFIPRFERAFGDATGASRAVAVSNGTVALHLSLHALGIGPGDEVIVPSFTYIASVNAIAQTGATPVFVDSRLDDWLLDPKDVAEKIGPRTKAIMAVHLYGAVCDMPALCAIARQHRLFLIEDCAEAIGCMLNGRHVGTFGEVGTFSFYGNKTISTGEGGMVITNDDRLAERLTLLKGHAQSPTRRYWHVEMGFNYRMTNVCAAIGVAQLERLPSILARKRGIAALYRHLLSDAVTFQARRPGVESGEWLVSVMVPEDADRDRIMLYMEADGVETRPAFFCAHEMPMYSEPGEFSNAKKISRNGINLPSYPAMSEADVRLVAGALLSAIARARADE